MLRSKFYAPRHSAVVGGSVRDLTRSSGGYVYGTVRYNVRNTGPVPERGSRAWTIRDGRDRIVASGRRAAETVYPGWTIAHAIRVRLGVATRLAAGTYKLRIRFITTTRTWRSPDLAFRQRY